MNIGRFGEGIACTYLQGKGYSIIKRNYYTRIGEIDIIAAYGRTLAFVEVKTRVGLDAGNPYEAISRKKLNTIKKVAYVYLFNSQQHYNELRIDVVAIVLAHNFNIVSLDHYENVTL